MAERQDEFEGGEGGGRCMRGDDDPCTGIVCYDRSDLISQTHASSWDWSQARTPD